MTLERIKSLRYRIIIFPSPFNNLTWKGERHKREIKGEHGKEQRKLIILDASFVGRGISHKYKLLTDRTFSSFELLHNSK